MPRPTRLESHRLEEESVLYFKGQLPREWTADKPEPDIGVDLAVNIFDGNEATSRELLVQLKASQNSTSTKDGLYERITMKTSTYNYLWDLLQVVLIVRYVASERTAYWQLLSQVPEPDDGNKTMTIRIPRTQTLRDESWRLIRHYVERVHMRKLGVRDRINLDDFANQFE